MSFFFTFSREDLKNFKNSLSQKFYVTGVLQESFFKFQQKKLLYMARLLIYTVMEQKLLSV